MGELPPNAVLWKPLALSCCSRLGRRYRRASYSGARRSVGAHDLQSRFVKAEPRGAGGGARSGGARGVTTESRSTAPVTPRSSKKDCSVRAAQPLVAQVSPDQTPVSAKFAPPLLARRNLASPISHFPLPSRDAHVLYSSLLDLDPLLLFFSSLSTVLCPPPNPYSHRYSLRPHRIMTYSPTHSSYSSYPVRYAYSSSQQSAQQQQQASQPQGQPPPHHPQHGPQHPITHYPKPSYSHLHHSQIPIKVEDSADLPPVSSLPNYDHHHVKSSSSSSSSVPIFRFGADFSSSASPNTPSTPFTFMSHQTWPSSSTSYAHSSQYGADRYTISSPVSPVNGQSHHALSLTDEYEDEGGDELGDLPSGGVGGITLAPYGGVSGGAKAGDKQVRRRSSKACDQCRKSKCKCERSSPQDPCRNCVMLGTQCTFLGPSRKRGPPKGYIDAIEARLHQTEALLGILLNSKDSRAKTVLEDLSEDPLAKDIITRVDNSPYGYKGRSRGAEAPSSRSRASTENREGGAHSVHATHPSNEWQDQVIARLNAAAATRNTLLPGDQVASIDDDADEEDSRPSTASQSAIAASTRSKADPPSTQPANNDSRRQRRRLDNPAQARSPSTTSSRSAHRRPEEESVEDSESGEDEIAIAVGQLSLNEDEQVRYHGKVSGLHLLGANERQDGRGIWRFPKARVWPPLSPAVRNSQRRHFGEFAPRLPDVPTQELLLELYFTYVHPALPIVHKPTFMDDWSKGNLATDSPYSGESGYSDAASPVSSSSPVGTRRRRVPTLLLLAMFSLAARYSTRTADVPPPDDGSMWSAGDEYMEDAKVILDRTYAASRPSTCQALLLLGFREVGIGAMAQAWLYLGMAVRMAQDLGLHKCAENWTAIGRNLFSKAELQERRRIWYGCVIMDKYICTYIGRPVAICERDFDTPLPLLEDPEEKELWQPHPTPQVMDDPNDIIREVSPMPGHIISCFNESAKLSIIISEICQSIYAIKPTGSRPAELARLDSHLTKWSLELPEHLRFDPASPKNPSPPPHILTLHMQYWCTILLLHRPFIRHIQDSMKAMSPSASSAKEAEIRANSRQHYDMCVQAANHITLIVSVFSDHFSPRRASVFLCYYVFTAAIMHVATLRTYPDDPQAARGLETTMEILRKMSVIWPSAWRALELLMSARASLDRLSEVPSVRSSFSETRNKRAAEDAIEEDVTVTDRSRMVTQDSQQVSPHQPHYPLNPSQSQSPVQGQSGHTSGQHGYSLSIDVPQSSAPAAYMPPSYDRWPTDGTSSSSLTNFGGSISTSVLPQQYSTGLVDGRIGTSMTRSSERQSQRYPQYWNDYSALGQMETTYSVPVIGEMVSHHQHGSAGHSSAAGHQQGMYVPSDQYPMFGSIPPSNQQ